MVYRTHTPVTIVVQTRGSTSSSSRYRGSNRGRDSRWQPGGCVNIHGVRIKVSVVVQTGGKVTCRNSRTARNDSDQLGLDPVVIHVSQPRGVTTRVVIRGGAPDSTRCSCGVCCGVQPRGVTTVSVLWSAPSSSRQSWFKPLLESLSWCQPRGVTTRVVIRGGCRTVRVVLA